MILYYWLLCLNRFDYIPELTHTLWAFGFVVGGCTLFNLIEHNYSQLKVNRTRTALVQPNSGFDLLCKQWRIYGVKFWTCVPPSGLIFLIFMQFLGKIGRIIGWYSLWGCRSHGEMGKSWTRADKSWFETNWWYFLWLYFLWKFKHFDDFNSFWKWFNLLKPNLSLLTFQLIN